VERVKWGEGNYKPTNLFHRAELTQLVTNSLPRMEAEGLFLCSQELAIGIYPELGETRSAYKIILEDRRGRNS